MKKGILIIVTICLMLVLFISGCTEQDNSGTDNNNGGTTGNTYTMTARELNEDMTMSLGDPVTIAYDSLEDGDTVIIHDTIASVYYNSETDRTTVTFSWTDEEMTTALNLPFEGDISASYQSGDEVKITVTIKHVTFSYTFEEVTLNYDIEIFEEQWTTKEEYIDSQGGALPATSIEKVE